MSVSFLLFLLCAASSFDVVALSFDDIDGVRLITEHRTTGSGDGERDGFGFDFKLIGSSVGKGSFSLISFCWFRSLSAFTGIVGYDLRWACVKTWPIAPYGMPPPRIDDIKRPAGRSVSVDFSDERFKAARSDVVDVRSLWWLCSENMSRSIRKLKRKKY